MDSTGIAAMWLLLLSSEHKIVCIVISESAEEVRSHGVHRHRHVSPVEGRIRLPSRHGTVVLSTNAPFMSVAGVHA